jgi:hypothetical protein
VRVRQGAAAVDCVIVADDAIALNCIRIAAAHPETVALGAMCGEISVERI